MVSTVGRRKLAGQVAFLVVDIIVLALSVQVNRFQDYFFVADLFPFALSIITLIFISLLTFSELASKHASINRPLFEMGIFGVLSVFWLSFNSFSSSRWSHIPLQCDSIPLSFPSERKWCKDLQALKAFVWINFLVCLGLTGFIVRFCVMEHRKGNRHVFDQALTRYEPKPTTTAPGLEDSLPPLSRSEWLQYEKQWGAN